jgi:hypothetical protein
MLVNTSSSDGIHKRRLSAPYLEAEEGTIPKDVPKRDDRDNKNRDNMTDAEDSLEKALYPALEQVIRENPNPQREGCPGHSFLEKAAASPGSLNAEENALFVGHVLKCWPCFAELKQLKKAEEAHKPPVE